MRASASGTAPPRPSSQSAWRSWSSERVAFGSSSYAASRMSAWRKRNASSPASAGPVGQEQVAPHELLEHPLGVGPREPRGERERRADVEDLALDGPALEQQPLRVADEVEPSREQRPDRRRRRELAGAPLAEMGEELLEEQRVAAGGRRDPRALVSEPLAGTRRPGARGSRRPRAG